MLYISELNIAKKAIIKAGDFLSSLKTKNVDSSYGKDIKLQADRKSEEIIISCLEKTGIGILSEEIGIVGNQNGLKWIIDPIDGTFNFFKGITDLCCVSIALWENDNPIFGVINRFGTNEIIEGVVGKETKVNGLIYKSSNIESIDKAVYATGFPVKMNYEEQNLGKYIKAVQLFKKVRMFGSAAIMSSFVGIGNIDVYSEDDIMLWDIAAGAAIIKAGGGEISYSAKNEFKCDFKGFANKKLMEDYYVRL